MDRKRKLEEECEKSPELKAKLNFPKQSGRPRIEVDQPLLLKSIVDIAYGSAAHENRQFELYRSIKTLDELTKQLQQEGYKISRSGFYLRLLPKLRNTHEGKRHVVTVPVKLVR